MSVSALSLYDDMSRSQGYVDIKLLCQRIILYQISINKILIK